MKAQELLKDNESDVDTLRVDADTVAPGLLLGGMVAGGQRSNWFGSGTTQSLRPVAT